MFIEKMKTLKNIIRNNNHLSKWGKIAVTSVVCFVVGITATAVTVISIRTAKQHSSVGGFEISAIPDFKEDFLDGDNADTEELLETQALLADDGEEAVQQDVSEDELSLTYQTYRVKSGDMIGFIADKYDVTQDTIISINNIKQSRLIQVGQYLKIPSMPGILYTTKTKGETPSTIAEKYKVDAEKCALVNNISIDTELESGLQLFVPDAQLDWATRQEINGDLFRKPLHSRYYLSSYYGWRDSPFNTGKRSFHTGIDMACSTGTPIYPAMDGVVTAAGYNSTYGNYVIVQHHSGYKTLYGHMSKITCRKGNFVYTTTQIGKVGSTGLSTGPHLHFTVYKNGKTVNPLGLLN
ncbi:MAG: M23 family metallopeptidase [Treponema sp.]|nr:M23 family metallopeptidase [Spirochaetia bacterium]MDD7768245.1 M23 family metallopeptidase [Treponema sp.]MDY3130478.1 M23 family metallopeptidase [Treponema sp.]